jgi:filamentous hemagglutinin
VELSDHRVIQKIGMNLDDATNGIFLHAETTHYGNHSRYIEAMRGALNDIPQSLSLDDTMARVYGIQSRASEKLLEGNSLRITFTASQEQWYIWLSKPF